MTATTALPNPFISDVVSSSPPTEVPGAEEKAAALVGDAPGAAATLLPPSETGRFKPDMNRLYLDIVSMPEPELMPLFLRKPSRAFMQALHDLGRDK